MRMATRRKKRFRIKYWRPSRNGSGRPPHTLMHVLMMRVRTSQRRKPRLLRVQLQSSSCHHVLVLSRPVVLMPLRVGEAQWQEG